MVADVRSVTCFINGNPNPNRYSTVIRALCCVRVYFLLCYNSYMYRYCSSVKMSVFPPKPAIQSFLARLFSSSSFLLTSSLLPILYWIYSCCHCHCHCYYYCSPIFVCSNLYFAITTNVQKWGNGKAKSTNKNKARPQILGSTSSRRPSMAS